ncbi:MAG: peptide deformylase [Xanthomonadales bacterium]|nr:peptide deformylase [Xanthomonadales bacterium]
MAILNIIEFPDQRLRTVAKAIETVNEDIRQLAANMLETMYDAPGIGLAATQVNIHKQLLVLDVSDEGDQPMVFINPEILVKDGIQIYAEGCLSVPGFTAEVQRAEEIRVKATNEKGESFELEAHGLLAICIQHEMDHLKGKLFVDYLSPLKRLRLKKKLEKQHKADKLEAQKQL